MRKLKNTVGKTDSYCRNREICESAVEKGGVLRCKMRKLKITP